MPKIELHVLIYYVLIKKSVFQDSGPGTFRADSGPFRADAGTFRADAGTFKANVGTFRVDLVPVMSDSGPVRLTQTQSKPNDIQHQL